MDDRIQSGAIIDYPYLWRWQRDRGESEGRKERPTCVLLAVRAGGLTHLALLPISSRRPSGDQLALEIPETERKRAGLSEFHEAWITISEYNYDIAERSFYFDPSAPILGRFSRSFVTQLARAAAPLFRRVQARVDRTE